MIVSMNKVKLFFMEESLDTVLSELQMHGIFMLDEKHKKQLSPSEDLIKTSKAIEILESYLKKRSIGNNEIVSKNEFNVVDSETKALVDLIVEKKQLYQETQELLSDYEKKYKALKPYEALEVNQGRFKTLTYTTVYLGKVLKEKLDTLTGLLQSLDCYIDMISEDDTFKYVSIVSLKEYQSQLDDLLEKGSFIKETNESFNQKNSLIIKFYLEEINKHQIVLREIDQLLLDKTNDLGKLKLLHDQYYSNDMRKQVSLLNTDTTLYIEGWMRVDQIGYLRNILDKKHVAYELDTREPLADEVVPTALKNNKFVKPFEYITNQFSVPSYKELDPNPLMSFWYWIIFGIMMADIGYGAVMILLFGSLLLFGKLKGAMKDLVNIFFLTGFTALLAGLVFGSFFGATILTPLMDPINDPVPMLIASLVIGLFHIICALIMKIINMVRQGDILSAINDAVSWIFILVGIALYALTLFITLDSLLMSILTYTALGLIGMGVIIIVLLNGRHQKSIMGKLMSAFTGLYNSTAYLSDILSYSRILALALSSAVIAFTMNLLADMVWNSIPVLGVLLGILVYLVGHIFNFVMGLLSAYVHAGRLQYLEYYGKFFEGGGYLFEPLSLQLKYVYQVKLKEEK
mgnify:CR=1 FL=1